MNPLVLLLAYSYDDRPKFDSPSAAMALGVTSAVCAVGAACVLAACEPRYRSSFYEHRTWVMHLRNFWWDDATAVNIDGKMRTNCDRETIRAWSIIRSTARYYWPMDLAEPFVRENWCVCRARFV